MNNENNPIWEDGYVNSQGVKETPKPYMYFQEYLKLGAGRSISKLADKVRQKYGESTGKKKTIKRKLEKYSSKFDWVERATAFDNQMFEDDLKLIQDKRRQLTLERLEEEKEDFKRNVTYNKEVFKLSNLLFDKINNFDKLTDKDNAIIDLIIKTNSTIHSQRTDHNNNSKTNIESINKFLDRYDNVENEVNIKEPAVIDISEWLETKEDREAKYDDDKLWEETEK